MGTTLARVLSLAMLLAPFAAGGSERAPRSADYLAGPEIAQQGNRALQQIRREVTRLQAPSLASVRRAIPIA